MFTSLASASLTSPPQTMMNDNTTFNLMRCPFTPSQWQELEHQALIFKYMASGRPVPPDLLLPFRRVTPTFMVDSPTPPIFPHHQPNIGWGCFQMGYGKSRTEDPEPGRCRRTDGKKWRCSKEAHPDSKYCERHMHRGKNRSRKHVEATAKTTTNNTSSIPMLASDPIPHHLYQYKPTHFSPQPQPSPTDVDLRCGFTPLALCSDSRKGDGGGDGKEMEHCFVLGADLVKHSQREDDGECPRTLRRFFDEWPLMREGGVEEEKEEEEERSSSSSRTQLSISTPLASCHHLSLR